MCKSLAPLSRQTTTPGPHHSFFYRPNALPGATPTVLKITGSNNNIIHSPAVLSPGVVTPLTAHHTNRQKSETVLQLQNFTQCHLSGRPCIISKIVLVVYSTTTSQSCTVSKTLPLSQCICPLPMTFRSS